MADFTQAIANWQERSLISEDGLIKAVWDWIGEGRCEEYDPSDPEDVPLLRFDVFVKNQTTGEWEDPGNASYCTLMPITSDPKDLDAALATIIREAHDGILAGGGYKRTLEWLSWMRPNK